MDCFLQKKTTQQQDLSLKAKSHHHHNNNAKCTPHYKTHMTQPAPNNTSQNIETLVVILITRQPTQNKQVKPSKYLLSPVCESTNQHKPRSYNNTQLLETTKTNHEETLSCFNKPKQTCCNNQGLKLAQQASQFQTTVGF